MWDIYLNIIPCLMLVIQTWSILRRSGISDTLRQHSCGDLPDSGRTCNAFTVSYEMRQTHFFPSDNMTLFSLKKRKAKKEKKSYIQSVYQNKNWNCLPSFLRILNLTFLGHTLFKESDERYEFSLEEKTQMIMLYSRSQRSLLSPRS